MLLFLLVVLTSVVTYSQLRTTDETTTRMHDVTTTTPEVASSALCWSRNCSRLSPRRTLTRCHLICGPTDVIWPQPSMETSIGYNIFSFRLDDIEFDDSAIDKKTVTLLMKACEVFKSNIRNTGEGPVNPDLAINKIRIVFRKFKQDDVLLTLETIEAYKLTVQRHKDSLSVVIFAASFFGARHALETLSQLIWWEEEDRNYKIIHDVTVVDKPRFPYRGVMVDTARNFMPMSALRRTVDGMAASKLNVLHLHLTDSQSFSFESRRYPEMSRYGAYSPDQVYKAGDLEALTEYATVRGVRILPEMDAPAHAGVGWEWGEKAGLGKLAVCIEEEPWVDYCGEPPCGQLNPVNENTYTVLQGLYEDLIEMTNVTDMFHFGGDEVNIHCWKKTPEIFPKGINTEESEVKDMIINFHAKALKAFEEANKGKPMKNAIVWSTAEEDIEVLSTAYPQESYIIQEWGSSSWENMYRHLNSNYRVILSNVDAWYLDCGYGTWMTLHQEACTPVASWQQVYMHRPWDDMSIAQKQLILGGEVCLWTEKVSPGALDTRLWPRAAAVAERLWSDPDVNVRVYGDIHKLLRDSTIRLALHRERLVQRGLGADAVWPEWCNRRPEACFDVRSNIAYVHEPDVEE